MDAFSALTHSAVCVQWPSPGCPVGPNAGSRSAAAVAMGGLGLWFGYFVDKTTILITGFLFTVESNQFTRAATGITTA